MRKLLAFALLAFREAARENAIAVCFLVSLLLIGILPTLALFVFREEYRMIVDNGLATVLGGGLALTCFCAQSSLGREVRTGAIAAVAVSPVSTLTLVMGKALGVLALLAVYVLACIAALSMSLRMAVAQFEMDVVACALFWGLLVVALAWAGWENFSRKSSFPERSLLYMSLSMLVGSALLFFLPLPEGKEHAFDTQAVLAGLTLLAGLLPMGAIALALALRLGLASSMLVLAMVFLVGVSSGLLSEHIGSWAQLPMALIPDWQQLWLSEAVVTHVSIPAGQTLLALVGGLLLSIAWLAFACTLMAGAEICEARK